MRARMARDILACALVFLVVAVRQSRCALYENTLHERAVLGDLDHFKEALSHLRSQEPWNGGEGLQNLLSSCYTPENSTCCHSKLGCQVGSCVILRERGELLCQTVLHAAAIGRQADIVEFLISELGMDPNIRTERGTTPLNEIFYSFTVYWHPCEHDFAETILTLLRLGADPNVWMTADGGNVLWTPLHFEAHDGNRHGILPALVAAGANVSARDTRGYTALHYAAICDFRLSSDGGGCANCICGLRLYTNNPSGSTACSDVYQCPVDPSDYDTSYPLTFGGATETIKYLVAKGADPFAVANDNKTVVDVMAIPRDPTNASEWQHAGFCPKTYDYLTSLGVKRTLQ